MNDSILGPEKKQAELLDQVLAIGQAIQQEIVKNPRGVYQLIVKVACQMTGADCAIIYPYHPSYGEFYDIDNIATYGLRHKLQLEERSTEKKGLTAGVHQKGEILHEDIEQQTPQLLEESPFMTREGIRSFMGLSLKVSNNIVGVLYVDYRKPHRFSEEEKKIIHLVGQQAAVAISNSWTFRLANIHAEAITRLKIVGQTLVAIEDLPKTLDQIVRSAQEILNADIVDLYQYTQARDEFDLPPILVGKRKYPDLVPTKIYEDDVLVRAVKLGEPQYSRDAQGVALLAEAFEVPRADLTSQRFVVREEVVSSATIPLLAAGGTVGVMFVNYRTPQLFGLEQRDIIESFAAQAALAIHNARLFQSERKQRQQSDKLRETAHVVSSTLELEEVIGSVLDQLGEVIEYDSASVQLIEGDRRRLVGGRGFLVGDSPRELLRNVSQDALINKIVKEKRPLVLSDIKDDPLWDHIPQTDRVNSWIGVPLVVQDQVIGLLTMDHEKAGYYTQESGDIAAAFANHAALAIRNAEIFSLELDFQILHEVANNLAKQPALEQIYQTAIQSALQTLHCAHSTIFMFNKAGHLVAMDRVGTPQPASEVRPFKPGEGLAGIVAETGKSMRVDDAAKDEHFIEGKVKPRSTPRSLILGPIKIEDEVIGVISADKDEIDGFTEHNLRVLEMLTLDIGAAINTHRQLQQVSDQAQALTELNELTHQLISIEESSRDSKNLLEQVATSAQEVLHADIVELYEYRQAQDEYRLPQISVGERRGSLIPKDKIYKDDAVFRLIHRKEPLYAERVQVAPTLSGPYTVERKDQPTERFITREEIQSTAAIPLRTGNEIVGLMFANYRTPQTFALEQRNLIELFANQAAIAIQNSRLFSESLRQRNELQVVDEVGKLLMSTLDSMSIPRLLLQRVIRLFGVEGASLWQVDRTSGKIKLLFSLDRMGTEERFTETIREITFQFGKGIVGTVAKSREPMIINQVEADPRWDKRVDDITGFKTKAILAVPLVQKQETIGVIEIINRLDETPFTTEDQDFLASIVSSAAIALENARLLQTLERRVEDLDALNVVGRMLTADIGQTEDEILDLIYDQTRKLINAKNISIAMCDEKTDLISFELVMEKGKRVDIEQNKDFGPRKINKAEIGKTEKVILTGKPILHRTRAEEAAWYKEPGHRRYIGQVSTSHLAVPMAIGNRVIGVITVYDWEQEYAYDESDLQVLTAMASQAAIALENARLFDETQKQVERLSTLYEIGRRITSTLEPDQILGSIAEDVVDLVGAERSLFILADIKERQVSKVSGHNYPPKHLQRFTFERVEAGVSGWVLKNRKPALVADARTDPRNTGIALEKARKYGTGPLIVTPLLVRGEIRGTLTAAKVAGDPPFTEDDLKLVVMLADQAAVALDNAEQYDLINNQLKRRIEELKAVSKFQQQISNIDTFEQELQNIYNKAAEAMSGLMDTHNMYIAFYNENTKTIEFPLAYQDGQRVPDNEQVKGQPWGPRPFGARKGLTEWVIRHKMPLLVERDFDAWIDAQKDVEAFPMGTQCWLGAPMLLRDKVIGVIGLQNFEREGVFDQNHRDLLVMIASQAAIAIDNANILDRRIAELKAISSFQQKIISIGTGQATL
ncbi:MAG: GAF domain-containing protein [Gammaproteobacteria bacterium]|nr:GAF domain-containing protein [Gammaproteobacteria bacterium]